MIDRWFRGISIHRQLTLLYCLVILVPLTGLLGLLYSRTQRAVEEELTYSVLQTVEQMAINIEYRMSAIMLASSILARNTELYPLLASGSEDFGTQIEETNRLRSILQSIDTSSDVYRLRLFVDSDHLFTRDGLNIFPLEEARDQPWYEPMKQAEEIAVWQSTYWVHYPLNVHLPVFSHVRILRAPNQYNRVLGFLVQDVQQSTFQQILASAVPNGQNFVGILDKEGYILSCNDPAALGTVSPHAALLAAIPPQEADGILKNGGVTLLYSAIRYGDWVVMADVSSSSAMNILLRTSAGSLLLIVCIVLVVLTLCVFVLMQLFAGYMYRRTGEILESMRQLGLEGFREWRESKNHLHVLEKSVDALVSSVREMMDSIYRKQLAEKDMKIRLLQAQINPHFLYNAIDQIYWKALQHSAPDVAHMLSALARYFRLTLHKGQDIVTLADEAALIKAYLTLQKSRFGNRFTAEIHMDETLGSYILPKMTLQPLVENALLHGILPRPEPGHLRIDIEQDGNAVRCAVHDNGLGMAQPLAASLLREPHDAVDKPIGYGIYNVNTRLVLFFGKEAALGIRSAEGEGTTVTLRIPRRVLEGAEEREDMDG